MSRVRDLNKLRRIPSKTLGHLVEAEFAKIYLIDKKGGLTLLTEDEDVTDSVLVGKGNQGSVYAVVVEFRANEGLEKRLCVLKQLPKQTNKLGQKSRSKTEPVHIRVTAGQITSIQHNILQGMAVIENQGAQFLLVPFSGLFLGGVISELPKLREDKKQSHLHDSILLHMISDLLIAIKFMHEDMNTVHQDIKEDNIAYYDGHGTLMDLDSASLIGATKEKTAGSYFYMHPFSLLEETFLGKEFRCQKQSDIYAMGVVLKLMLGDQETVKKRKEWEQCTDPSEINKKISAEREAAIALFQKRRDTNPVDLNLEKELSRFNSVQRKLEKLAEIMTSPWPFDQPNIDRLIACCNDLKNQLLESHKEFGSVTEQETELREYYESLIKKNKNKFLSTLDEDVTTPLRNTTSRVSLFDESFKESFHMTSTGSRSRLFSRGASGDFSKKSSSDACCSLSGSSLFDQLRRKSSTVDLTQAHDQKPKKT